MDPEKKGEATGSHCQHRFLLHLIKCNPNGPKGKLNSVGTNHNHCLFKKENKDLIMANESRKAWNRFKRGQKCKTTGLGNCLVWTGFSAYGSCFEFVQPIPSPEPCVITHSLYHPFLLRFFSSSSLWTNSFKYWDPVITWCPASGQKRFQDKVLKHNAHNLTLSLIKQNEGQELEWTTYKVTYQWKYNRKFTSRDAFLFISMKISVIFTSFLHTVKVSCLISFAPSKSWLFCESVGDLCAVDILPCQSLT